MRSHGFLLAIKTDVEEALRSLHEAGWMTRYRRAKLARLMKEDVGEPMDAEDSGELGGWYVKQPEVDVSPKVKKGKKAAPRIKTKSSRRSASW